MELSQIHSTKRNLNKVSRYCVAFIIMSAFILLVLNHLGYYPLSDSDNVLVSYTKILLFICTMDFLKAYKRDLSQ